MGRNTKDVILDSAISLFNTKGYSGTSIRDISTKANVNVSNIAYYFQNKRGLLEYCFTTFFEEYLAEIEKGFHLLSDGATVCLKEITKRILHFQFQNLQLTRFILREMSIDSQVVREIMSTYYVKERYFFKKVFEEGMRTREFLPLSINYMIIQYKGLLSMPFLNTFYVSEVLHVFPHEQYFAKKYLQEINNWIDGVLVNHTNHRLPIAVK